MAVTHPGLFSAAVSVPAPGFLRSLSGRLGVFLKEAVLNEAGEGAAPGQLRLIVLDGWQDQSEHQDPLTPDSVPSLNTPKHFYYNRSDTLKMETVSNLTWRRWRHLCISSKWAVPVGQRAAPVITHLVLLRLRQRSRGHLAITLLIKAIFLSSHDLQRFQQSDDAILIHQTGEVMLPSSLAALVLTAGGWRGWAQDTLLFYRAPFRLHSSSFKCGPASVAIRGNLSIVLGSETLLGDHGCGCLWTQDRTSQIIHCQIIS